MRIVVVGASLGGVRTVQALRRAGSEAELVLVGDEPGAPDGVAADRPPLSKAFLADPAVEARPLSDRERLGALGIEDGEALLERGRHHAAAARDAAFRLFDAFWERART